MWNTDWTPVSRHRRIGEGTEVLAVSRVSGLIVILSCVSVHRWAFAEWATLSRDPRGSGFDQSGLRHLGHQQAS
jgi:hypothetical protein